MAMRVDAALGGKTQPQGCLIDSPQELMLELVLELVSESPPGLSTGEDHGCKLRDLTTHPWAEHGDGCDHRDEPWQVRECWILNLGCSLQYRHQQPNDRPDGKNRKHKR